MAMSSTPSGSGPEVRTAAGVVRGSREAGLAVFRGIPFAEPSRVLWQDHTFPALPLLTAP